MLQRKIIYALLIIVAFLISIDIWIVTNLLALREIGYLVWEGGLAMMLFLVSALLVYTHTKDPQTRKGTIIVLGIMMFSVLVTLNYAPMVEFVDKLTYYLHLMLTSSVLVLIGMVGNIVGLEKTHDEGFAIHLYHKDSPIPVNMIIPTWLLVFIGMGGLVLVSGTVLVQYPSFGTLIPFLGGPATSGFSVGDAENLAFMIFPFAITMMLCRYKKFLPITPCFLVALIAGMTAFTTYHTLVYSANMIATIIVAIFGAVSLISYHYTKSIVIMSSLHIGNNFWGALFNVNVLAITAFGVTAPLSTIFLSIFIIAIATLSITYIIRRYGKKPGRRR